MSAPPGDASARDPGERRRVALSRQQRARISAAAVALERYAGHDEDPLGLLLAASELRAVVAHWDAASPREPAGRDPQRLEAALRRIADGESGVWGSIASDALDDDRALPAAATGDANGRR
jgi:hypothetical protein